MAVIDWWNGPLTLVVIFFALCLLLLTWSIASVACRACHSSGTFFSFWHTHTHTHTRAHTRTHTHTHTHRLELECFMHDCFRDRADGWVSEVFHSTDARRACRRSAVGSTMGAYPRDTGSNPVEGNGHFFPLIPSALSFVFLWHASSDSAEVLADAWRRGPADTVHSGKNFPKLWTSVAHSFLQHRTKTESYYLTPNL